jgi:hypothetical protein
MIVPFPGTLFGRVLGVCRGVILKNIRKRNLGDGRLCFRIMMGAMLEGKDIDIDNNIGYWDFL